MRAVRTTFVGSDRLWTSDGFPVCLSFVPISTGQSAQFTIKFRLPNSTFVFDIETLTRPVDACAGTVATRQVLDTRVKLAATLLKVTLMAELKPCPRITTADPGLPKNGDRVTKAGSPAFNE